VLALLSLLLAACASTHPAQERAAGAIRTTESARAMISAYEALAARLQTTVLALRSVLSVTDGEHAWKPRDAEGVPRPEYARFVSERASLTEQYERTSRQAGLFRTTSAAYLDAWRRELPTIRDAATHARSADHLRRVELRIDDARVKLARISRDYDALVARLAEHERTLGRDRDDDATRELEAAIHETSTAANSVLDDLQRLMDGLRRMIESLSSGGSMVAAR
jgi:hypothetical protein